MRSFSDQLGMLPLPLHPLLEENASDASQAMKDMHRERITLDVSSLSLSLSLSQKLSFSLPFMSSCAHET